MKRLGITMVAAMTAVLGGCALPVTVRHADARAQEALRQSGRALAVAHREAVRRRQALSVLRSQLAELEARQAALARALYAQRRGVAGAPAPAAAWGQTQLRTDRIFKTVLARASALAARPYQDPPPIPPVLKSLSYTDYGKIGFPGRLPGWRKGTPFHVSLYPAGYLFTWPTEVHVITGSHSVLARLPAVVSGDPQLAQQLPASVPTAGFSVYSHAAGTPLVKEFLSFLGASYFRAVGLGEVWGSSARGVAVDTALPHRREEFPYFREFWIVAPGPNARHLGFCALLDSPSLTGAYRFIVRPGRSTVMDVKAVLFERHKVRRLGIAPLTSMFLQGRFSTRRYNRLIRSAHDSDGLLIDTAKGRRLWRPLRNPHTLAVVRFPLRDPRGFGLMQRARRAQDYRVLGMHYENRPSVWVRPEGSWGSGHLLLVELPSDSQSNDNISAFWVPGRQAPPGQPFAFRYRIVWSGATPSGAKFGYVSSSRYSYNARLGRETYIVDFRGKRLADPALSSVRPDVRIQGPARVTNAWVTRNGAPGHWRLEFEVQRTGSGSATIQAALAEGGGRLTEIWADDFPLR
ncbi:MAG: glucan biosynthesis protein [Gammaproteobacteria bacterium]|nr:glucan biosynthesis protein [Gammaproteobacteria bacterium]